MPTGKYFRRFGGTCHLHNQGNPRRENYLEEGDSRFLRKFGSHIQTRKSSFVRKLELLRSLLNARVPASTSQDNAVGIVGEDWTTEVLDFHSRGGGQGMSVFSKRSDWRRKQPNFLLIC